MTAKETMPTWVCVAIYPLTPLELFSIFRIPMTCNRTSCNQGGRQKGSSSSRSRGRMSGVVILAWHPPLATRLLPLLVMPSAPALHKNVCLTLPFSSPVRGRSGLLAISTLVLFASPRTYMHSPPSAQGSQDLRSCSPSSFRRAAVRNIFIRSTSFAVLTTSRPSLPNRMTPRTFERHGRHPCC